MMKRMEDGDANMVRMSKELNEEDGWKKLNMWERIWVLQSESVEVNYRFRKFKSNVHHPIPFFYSSLAQIRLFLI